MTPIPCNLEDEIQKLARTILCLMKTAKNGWVYWDHVSKVQTGSMNDASRLCSLASLPKWQHLFAMTKNVVKLTLEGIEYITNAPPPPPVVPGVVASAVSFNFTKNAEQNNAENLPVIRFPELATKYISNWDGRVEHSEKYAGKIQGYSETHRAATEKPEANAGVSNGYVASKNSAVFHKADCKSAAKISAKHMVRYTTREEAIQAGKTTCHECSP